MKAKYILLMLSFAVSSVSYAAEWSIEGSVRQDIFYDDNVFLSENNREGSLGYILIPEIVFAHRTDNSEISAHASYGLQRYFNVKGLDFELQNYGLKTRHNLTERFEWGGRIEYSILPERNGADSFLEDPTSSAERTTKLISPYVSYKLTELDTLKLSLRYSESISSANQSVTNTNKNINADLGWSRKWTERYSTRINFSYEIYNSESISSDTVGIRIYMKYLLSETWSVFTTFGGRMTESSSSSIGFLVDTGVNYSGENLTGKLSGGRSLLPSSDGQLREVDQLKLDLSYLFTSQLSAGFSGSYRISGNGVSSNENDSNQRELINLGPYVNYQLNPEWSLSASYQYRLQKGDALGGTSGYSNLLMLSINYNWQGLRIAR